MCERGSCGKFEHNVTFENSFCNFDEMKLIESYLFNYILHTILQILYFVVQQRVTFNVVSELPFWRVVCVNQNKFEFPE